MRIISGQFKSRRFNYKLPDGIRPTTDMAKETLFNIFDNILEYRNLRVLDLYSGSGSIGIEFLSRGAEFVHFNDKNINSTKYIKRILDDLKVENYKISKANSSIILDDIGKEFDLIYIDPPYFSNEYQIIEKVLSINKSKFLDKIIVVESDLSKKINWEFNLIKEKVISSSRFLIYKID